MIFVTDFYPSIILKRAGYQKHPKGRGFIREIGKNRFHAIIIDENLAKVDLHYDKNQGDYHSAAPKLHLLKPEIKRIKKVKVYE